MSSSFYVYLLKRSCSGEYYVGKGTEDRPRASMKEHNCDELRRLVGPITEDEAFCLEDKIWCEMKKRGFKLINKRRPERYGHCDERSGCGRRFQFQGKCLTLTQWAAELGISRSKLYNRYHHLRQRGPICTEELFRMKEKEPEKLVFKGITKSLYKWAKEFNLNPMTLRSRLQCGWTVEEALTIPLRVCNQRIAIQQGRRISEGCRGKMMLTSNGRTLSVRAWAQATGLRRGLIWDRLRRGYSIEEALTIKDGRFKTC